MTKLQSKPPSTSETESELSPIFLRKLDIYNAFFIFKIDDRLQRIPFEINVIPENAGYNQLKLTASMYPRGQFIRTEAEIDLKHQKIILNSATDSLDLNRFADLAPAASNLMVSGKLDLKATAHFQLTPFKISSLDAAAEVQNCKIRLNNLLLQNVRSSDQKRDPHQDQSI